ncbi:hypothetical protein DEU56DRAFT_910060 [Suillus clintonianus]|uniref:uncharacterized protein n=1 Tax=Suillus clintonianus TaxID=1904413 RepID=UPI001B87A6AC|nr:uncharacterized protein DEU56DRAFT_910060 [Suillus clintonianus]KAG2145776.1 hypothetical protein DEU56DRAFT_910060 [Suillus clintonianus]
MASTSTKPATTGTAMILAPAMTLRGHEDQIRSISYFPSGERMISGSDDLTTRQWDLQLGKEISKLRDDCQRQVRAVAVSRDGRWIATGGSHSGRGELKACDVQTGIVKTFESHSQETYCIDISEDSTLLVSGALDRSARIWSLETGKFIGGPFTSVQSLGAVRFSQDSKKLAVMTDVGKCLEVWDIHTQKMKVRVGRFGYDPMTYAPVFWRNKNTTIIAAFSFTDGPARSIYEFDASTLETIGTPFEGHTMVLAGLALSSDGDLLISACYETIKIWAFDSRHLLASFDVLPPHSLTLSPDSRQLAYTSGSEIYIYNTPAEILAQASTGAHKKSSLGDLLKSEATRRPGAVRRNPGTSPGISFPPTPQRPPATGPQQSVFARRLRKLLRMPSHANAVPNNQPRNPLDFPATSALPRNRSPAVQATTRIDSINIGATSPRHTNGFTQFLRQHLSLHRSRPTHEPPTVEVAAGRKFTRLKAAKLPEYRKAGDTRHLSRQQSATVGNDPPAESSDLDSLPDVHWCKAFFCYYSCWSHGRLRMPPRWRLERVYPLQQTTTASGSGAGAQGRS